MQRPEYITFQADGSHLGGCTETASLSMTRMQASKVELFMVVECSRDTLLNQVVRLKSQLMDLCEKNRNSFPDGEIVINMPPPELPQGADDQEEEYLKQVRVLGPGLATIVLHTIRNGRESTRKFKRFNLTTEAERDAFFTLKIAAGQSIHLDFNYLLRSDLPAYIYIELDEADNPILYNPSLSTKLNGLIYNMIHFMPTEEMYREPRSFADPL